MRYLALFTADHMTPPSPEMIQKMNAFTEKQKRSGHLVATGGLKRRDADGLRVRRKNGKATVEQGGAPWAAATGWAILEANSRDELIDDVKKFLDIAGDGISEVIEISDMSKPN